MDKTSYEPTDDRILNGVNIYAFYKVDNYRKRVDNEGEAYYKSNPENLYETIVNEMDVTYVDKFIKYYNTMTYLDLRVIYDEMDMIELGFVHFVISEIFGLFFEGVFKEFLEKIIEKRANDYDWKTRVICIRLLIIEYFNEFMKTYINRDEDYYFDLSDWLQIK
jgi:hypothetical protein